MLKYDDDYVYFGKVRSGWTKSEGGGIGWMRKGAMDWYMEKKENDSRYQLINRCWMIYFLIYL